jgi:hypothetical protein
VVCACHDHTERGRAAQDQPWRTARTARSRRSPDAMAGGLEAAHRLAVGPRMVRAVR